MKTLLWKEIREHRFVFLLLILLGIGLLAVLQLFERPDDDIVIILLFLIACPLFVFIFGLNLFSSEITGGTIPFLMGLPEDPRRIWWAKLGSGILFTFLLYASYLALAYLFGVRSLAVDFFRGDLPWLAPGFLLAGLPLMALTLGYLGTMFQEGPRAFVVFSLILFILFLYFQLFLVHFNLLLFSFLISALYLVSSRWSFGVDKTLHSSVTDRRGILFFLAGICVLFLIWIAIDRAANSRLGKSARHFYLVGSPDGGKTVLLETLQDVPWWDTIRSADQKRIIRVDLASGRVENFLPRHSILEPVELRRPVHGFTEYWWPGFRGLPRLFLAESLDSPRYYIFPKNVTTVFPLDSNRVIYRRIAAVISGQAVAEYRIRDLDGQESPVCTTMENELKFVEMNDTTGQMILSFPKEQKLVSLKDGKSVKIDHPRFVKRDLGIADGFIGTSMELDEEPSGATESRELDTAVRVFRDGKTEKLTWIPRWTKLVSIGPDGSPVGYYEKKNEEKKNSCEFFLAKFNLTDRSVSEIASFPDCERFSAYAVPDSGNSGVLFYVRQNGSQFVRWIDMERPFDSTDLSPQNFPPFFPEIDHMVPLGNRMFGLKSGDSVYLVDIFQKKSRKVISLPYGDSTGNGGAK